MTTSQRSSDLERLKQARQHIAEINKIDQRIEQLQKAVHKEKNRANNVPPVTYHPVHQRQNLLDQYTREFADKNTKVGTTIATIFSIISLIIFIWSCKVLFPAVNADADAGGLRVVFKIIHILLGVILILINCFFGIGASVSSSDKKEDKK